MALLDQTNRTFKDSQDIWSPYKELYHNVSSALYHADKKPLHFLEDLLRVHKITFVNLLKNVPKDEKCRTELRQYAAKNCSVPGRANTTAITEQLMQEAFIVSDLFELNEYIALDLICMAEMQLPSYPGLTRGLVAVLLYYDGRSAICDTLCLLAQARNGVSWELNAESEVSRVIGAFMDQLVSCNLIGNILELLEKVDVSKEMSKLQENRGLGGAKHQHKISSLINKTRQSLADTVFCLSAQAGLPHEPLMKLIKYISTSTVELDGSGVIDGVTLALQMALLYAIDVSVILRREDTEDLVQKLPLVYEKHLVRDLTHALSNPKVSWKCKGLQALTQFAWGLSICNLRMAPSTLKPYKFDLDERDEDLVNFALDDKVFEFMHRSFLKHVAFAKEEFYMRRMHALLTDFLILMPLKVKELKNEADAVAKTFHSYADAGLRPPTTLSRNFEQLLDCFTTLYKGDEIGLELSLEFWSTADAQVTSSGDINILAVSRSTQAQSILNKFIQSIGDMLPPALYVSYLNLLTALAKGPRTSKHAFALLNGQGTISWDHFFKSLQMYAYNLHKEVAPAPTDSIYLPRATHRGINPMELPALYAVLALIKTVAECDPLGRVVLAENPAWDAVQTILGLVKCSVPIPLKADLLLCLAAMAKNHQVADDIWQKLEYSGVIATVPSTSTYQPQGIETELEEVEARGEEFPLSRAMLKLLLALSDSVQLPLLLGVGRRTPGLEPYLRFVVDSVFLKYRHRTYRCPEEKWEVAELCTRLLVRFLSVYEPKSEYVEGMTLSHNEPGAPPITVSSPPGQNILIMLNCNSQLVQTVLGIVDEACYLLEKYQTFPGKQNLEEAALHSLTLLHLGLIKGPKLIKLSLETADVKGISVPVMTGLDKIILGLNTRTGHMDHPINISKFLGFSEWLSDHSLFSVKILSLLVKTPTNQEKLFRIFSDARPEIVTAVLNMFVECLDDVVAEEPSVGSKSQLVVQIKQSIILFLMECLNYPAPTLAHLLLGFNTKRPLKETVLQHPGVTNNPRTCLHSVINLLDKSLPNVQGNKPAPGPAMAVYMDFPYLMERCLALLHELCHNPDTARPTLRYLRATSDFLTRHLVFAKAAIKNNSACSVMCAAWVMRCSAIDLKLNTGAKNRLPLLNLLKPVSTDDTNNESGGQFPIIDKSLLSYSLNADIYSHLREFVCGLVEHINFSKQSLDNPSWLFMEHNNLMKLLAECEIKEPGPHRGMVDVAKVNQRLRSILMGNISLNTSMQRNAIAEEIKEVLNYATKLNETMNLGASNVRVFEGWSHLIAMLFLTTPLDMIPVGERHSLLLLLIRIIIMKIQEPKPASRIHPKVSCVASTSLLLLLQALRQCHTLSRGQGETVDVHAFNLDPQTIKFVISGISYWLQFTPTTEQSTRANLYGSLITFLLAACCDVCDKDDAQRGLGGSFATMYSRSMMTSGPAAEVTTNSRRRLISVQELVNCGESLCSCICWDGLNGHDVTKMLCYSLISTLVELEPEAGWTRYMKQNGFLHFMVMYLAKCDQPLMESLKTVPRTLKPLYIFESLTSMLCRLCLTRGPAELLLRDQLLVTLSSMNALNCHPYPLVPEVVSSVSMLPSVAARYEQVLLPALLVCNAALVSLTKQNQSCVEQVAGFMISHNEAMSLVLRGGHPMLPCANLRILRIVLSLLTRVTSNVAQLPRQAETEMSIKRFGQLAEALLPRFKITVNLRNRLRAKVRVVDREADPEDTCLLYALRINNLLTSYLRCVAYGGQRPSFGLPCLVFKPSVSSEVEHSTSTLSVISGGTQVLDMGFLLEALEELAAVAGRVREDRDSECSKLSMMDSRQINTIRKENEGTGNVRDNQKMRLDHRNEEMKMLTLIIEQTLHMLWAHLDVYFKRNLPQPGHTYSESLLSFEYRPSLNEMRLLKDSILTKFTESVEIQLNNAMKEENENRQLFVQMLIRRIKRLVQFVPV